MEENIFSRNVAQYLHVVKGCDMLKVEKGCNNVEISCLPAVWHQVWTFLAAKCSHSYATLYQNLVQYLHVEKCCKGCFGEAITAVLQR